MLNLIIIGYIVLEYDTLLFRQRCIVRRIHNIWYMYLQNVNSVEVVHVASTMLKIMKYTVFIENAIWHKSVRCSCKFESASLHFLIFPVFTQSMQSVWVKLPHSAISSHMMLIMWLHKPHLKVHYVELLCSHSMTKLYSSGTF